MTDLRMTSEEHDALAERLHGAARTGQGIDPPSETMEFTFDDAYRVRRRLVDRLIADGGAPKGHKIGFTAEVMQKMYGMSGPDFGQLLDTMFAPYGEPVAVGHLSDTRVEPEIAFEMAQDLAGPGVSVDDVLASTALVYPSIEVIDSRVGAMRASAVDSIADNAGAGLVVLGPKGFDPQSLDLAGIQISATVGEETLTGLSGDVMDHPAAAVAWLANRLAEIDGLGGAIKKGDIIMSGSCTRSMAVAPGSRLDADFGPMGTFAVSFV